MIISSSGQYTLKGRVFDSTGTYPIESVNVYSSSGRITATDTSGWYIINVSDNDSVWFSYLGKNTIKYPADYALSMDEFDVSLRISIPVLKEVRVKTRDHKMDSLVNRYQYAKVFNYKKPSFKSIVISYGLSNVIDLDELIRALGKKKIRSQLNFQKRLLNEEHEKYIDYRFSKLMVSRLTGLKNEELSQFMRSYRPSYETALLPDYQFREYIMKSYRSFCF